MTDKQNIPNGWAEVELGFFMKTGTGSVDPSKFKDEVFELYSIPVYDSGKPEIIKGEKIGSSKKIVSENDVLLSRIVPHIQRSWIVGPYQGYRQIGSGEWIIFDSTSINPKYLRYFLLSYNFHMKFMTTISGVGGSLTRANPSLTAKFSILIPPLNEQNRIVDKLDELLSELEKGKEQLQTSLEQLKVYRQSILKHAFEGKLTNTSVNNEELPGGWKIKTVKQISNVLGDGLHGTPKYSEDGDYFFINGNNLTDGVIEIKNNTKRVSKTEFEKYKKPLNDKTILVSINGSIGYTAFYNNEQVVLGKSACYFNVVEGINKKYVRYFLKSNAFTSYANENATGSTIKNLGLKAMRDFPIPFPPNESEQDRIVELIESQFSIYQNLEETIQSNIREADVLKQSLLEKAFEGALVDQDPTDEPAPVLLERIKKQREEFLYAEKERKKVEKPLYIKTKKMAEELKRIIEILKESKAPVSAKTLWQSSTHKDDIDDFYAALKRHIEAGEIIELPRKGKESFLKLADSK